MRDCYDCTVIIGKGWRDEVALWLEWDRVTCDQIVLQREGKFGVMRCYYGWDWDGLE